MIQRVSSAFALAAMTAMTTTNQNQVAQDLATKIDSTNPAVSAMSHRGAGFWYAFYQQVQARAIAVSYANVFLACALIAALATVCGFLLPRGRNTG